MATGAPRRYPRTMAHVLKWNGKDLPDELRMLPAGDYVVERVDAAPALSDEQEEGLRAAMAEIDAGLAETPEDLRRHLEAVLRK